MFFVKMISRLPLGVLYIFSDFLFIISYYLLRYRRRIVWKNLTKAFPEKEKIELRKIEREFYLNLCDYAVETLKLLTINEEELLKRVRFKNPEEAIKHLKHGQSVLCLASHQFNWEWLMVCASIAYSAPIDFVYQSVHNKFFDNLSLMIRTRFGAHPVRRDGVARESIRRNKITRGVAIMADQYPGYGRDKKYQATFLNQNTVFFYGVNQLAQLTQYPAFFHQVRKIKRGYYEATLEQISQPPYAKNSDELIENYVKAVEKMIREEPAGWLWSHDRWKTRHLTRA